MSHGRVLIVDDEELDVGKPLTRVLERAGFDCLLCLTAEAARVALREAEYDFALIDYNLETTGDGAILYDELERDFPGMEMAIFTSKPESFQGTARKVFEIPKDKIPSEAINIIGAAILKGVASGLRKRLEWQSHVVKNAKIRSAVLDENNHVVWENNRSGDGTIKEFLARDVLNRDGCALWTALQERRESFEDILECSDGRWLECEVIKLPDSATRKHGSYRLLTTKETTRTMQAANLAKELLQHDQFDEISALICDGLLNLGFCRARLWVLQGDYCTLALYMERGHNLTPEEIRECKMDFRKNLHLMKLLGKDNRDAQKVDNPAAYLPDKLCKILNITNEHPTLGIPLFVREELLGMLTVDKAGPETVAEKGKDAIARSDELIGKQIGRLAAAALDRGIHEWQFKRVQEILSQTQHKQPDEKIDEIYHPVFDKIIASLGNDPTAPWLPQFQGAEIAVRRSRLARNNRFYLIYTTPNEKDVFPPIVDITEGLIGDVLAGVRATPATHRIFELKTFRNIFANKAFQKHFLKLRQEEGSRSLYVHYLQQNQTKTMIPLLDLDKELLGFLCFHAPCTTRKQQGSQNPENFTLLHGRWLEVLGQLCSRILEIRERHRESWMMLEQMYGEMDKKQTMANYGELCGDITHELPQYFQKILGDVHLLRTAITDPRPERDPQKRLDSIRTVTMEANNRLETLKKLFKDAPRLSKGKAAVAHAIERTLKKIDAILQVSNVTCTQELPAALPPWPLTIDQSEMIFTILIKNACESIRNAGRTVGRIEIRARWESPALTVTVADNGGGIAPEHLDDLFEVGFSTKQDSTRMGLGLSMVRRIVTSHKGSIAARSDYGQGATFQLEFPIEQPPPEVSA